MSKLRGRTSILVLSIGAALGVFLGPAMATTMTYSPGTYGLSENGTYIPQGNQWSNPPCAGTSGAKGNCPYIPADFAHSDVENSGNGTTYNFYFTVGMGSTDYLNVSEGSTGTIEGFKITTYTYTGSPSAMTLVSGPLLYNDTTGISLAFSAGGSAVNYYVTINLYCGDRSACTAGNDIDPTNDISDTSSADYSLGVAAAPLPSALPMMGSGLGLLWVLSRRRKREAALAA